MRSELRSGVVSAVLAYGAWGIFPLYWKLLDGVPPTEVLAFRIVSSLVFLLAYLAFTGALPALLATLRDPRSLGWLALSSVLIGVNWSIFIAAIQLHHVADASLGYFLNPLLNVALGVFFLKERLRRLQAAAVGLAALAMLLLMGGEGLPWIALVLAGSFAIYGLVRKSVKVAPTVGLAVETIVLTPVALTYLAWLGTSHSAVLNGPPSLLAAAIFAGPITALPLAWFARAARALPLSTLGLIQYLAPTGQFLLAVLAFGESMAPMKWAAVGLIWVALAVFSVDLVRAHRQP